MIFPADRSIPAPARREGVGLQGVEISVRGAKPARLQPGRAQGPALGDQAWQPLISAIERAGVKSVTAPPGSSSRAEVTTR